MENRNISTPPFPMLGLGTYGRTGTEGIHAMLKAIEIGYRHLDTAQSYGTETFVGEAIKASGLPRDDFFITTKVADTRLGRDQFLPSVEASLSALNIEQIDLLLIHWPAKDDAVPFEDYMLALLKAREQGMARQIGVSNYPVTLLERAEKIIGKGQIIANQVEIHPYLQNERLTQYCRNNGIQTTAYMPLAKGRVTDDALLLEIAAQHGVSASAIALAFLMAEGHAVIPSSANAARLQDNFASLKVMLSAKDIARFRLLNRDERMIDPPKAPVWDV
jgi:2,5-diketo-D-gluconate reductase B